MVTAWQKDLVYRSKVQTENEQRKRVYFLGGRNILNLNITNPSLNQQRTETVKKLLVIKENEQNKAKNIDLFKKKKQIW